MARIAVDIGSGKLGFEYTDKSASDVTSALCVDLWVQVKSGKNKLVNRERIVWVDDGEPPKLNAGNFM